MNPDFRDMLFALAEEAAEYLLVGAYALAVHGVPRATGDLDVWVRPTADNARRVRSALVRFGAPLADLTEGDLVRPGTVFQIGVAPNRIDLLTSIDGVTFDEAWPARRVVRVEGLDVPVLARHHLIRNKKTLPAPDRAATRRAMHLEHTDDEVHDPVIMQARPRVEAALEPAIQTQPAYECRFPRSINVVMGE